MNNFKVLTMVLLALLPLTGALGIEKELAQLKQQVLQLNRIVNTLQVCSLLEIVFICR